MSEKKNDSLLENKMKELNFTSKEINDQVCATTKMKQKKKLVKNKEQKRENVKSDLIMIEDDSLKQKQKKTRY